MHPTIVGGYRIDQEDVEFEAADESGSDFQNSYDESSELDEQNGQDESCREEEAVRCDHEMLERAGEHRHLGTR